MTALVFLATFTIKFPLPYTGGYIHLGDSMVFVSGIILGKKRGAFAAGVGSALADIASIFFMWSLPTFIIKAFMAYLIGSIYSRQNNLKTISVLASLYVLIWTPFLIATRSILINLSNKKELIKLLEDINTEKELMNLINNVQLKLLIMCIVLPIIVIIILLISSKFKKSNLSITNIIGFIVAGSFMVVGYYLTEYILYGNYIIPIFSIPLNIIQFIVGIIIAQLLLPVITKIINKP
jgi:uncharacterized membrane protein